MKTTKILTILVLALGLMVWSGQEASGGTLAAWGNNGFGQCDVPAGKDFVAIAAGRGFSLALKANGSLAAWGYNGFGQCDVPAGNDFVDIAAGYGHSLALKSDGSLAAWGKNDYGECNVPDGNNFVAIAGGESHSLALKSDGSLAAWGRNDYGQCDVPAGNDFAAIAAGVNHSLALKSDGSLAAWGGNSYGQRNVPAGNDFVAVAAGESHSLALKSDGSLAAWGRNDYGQCDVPAGNNFVTVAGGGMHSLAIKSDGSLAAWGWNSYGQCDVPAGNFVAIAAGTDHNLAIAAAPMGTAFTYQGRLLDKGTQAEGLYDFQFKVYNDIGRGMQKGSTIDINDLDVIEGQFTVELDFGSDVFAGDARWLETAVRPGDSKDVYTTLSPRQELTPTPYAIYALRSDDADKLDGLDSTEFASVVHSHSGSDITTGTVADARIDETIARDWELAWGNLANIPAGFADGIDNVGAVEVDFVAGDFLICANDTERSSPSTSWIKLKEIKIGRGGTLRIEFGIKSGVLDIYVFAEIRRNNVPVGTFRRASSGYGFYIEDIAGWSKGDLVQVWGRTTKSSCTVNVKGLRLYVDNPAEAAVNPDAY